MSSDIFFRNDSNATIGLGHLVRSLALAQMLKDDFNVIFACQDIPENMVTVIKEKGFSCLRIVNEAQFFSQIKFGDIVVLDGYQFDTEYQKIIKSSGCKLVCIDDLHNQEFFADLIINHSPGVLPQDYLAQTYTKFALGLEYALIRPKFLEQAKLERTIEKLDTIFICFGGSDPNNFTLKILKVVLGFERFKKVLVVTGSEYQSTECIKAIVDTDSRVEHFQNVGETQMLSIMLRAEFAIVPASSISIEILHVGLILFTGITIDNQKNIYAGLIKRKNVYGIGDFNQLDTSKLSKSIQEVLDLIKFPITFEIIKQKPLNLQISYVFNLK